MITRATPGRSLVPHKREVWLRLQTLLITMYVEYGSKGHMEECAFLEGPPFSKIKMMGERERQGALLIQVISGKIF